MVLQQISVSFEQGKIYGLYGRNGCGKTMLLRAIAGLIYPTSGEIIVGGKELHKDISFPESVGVIIENTSLLPQFDAYTNLKHLTEIKKIAFAFGFSKAVLVGGGQSLVILHADKIGCLCCSVKRREPIEKCITEWYNKLI